MRFGLLGPVTAERDGAQIAITAPSQRTVLAVLLLDANTAVSADRLVEALWGERPPASANASLYNHVMRLRRLLGDEGGQLIRVASPGYLIRIEPGDLDLHAFTDLCAAGAAAVRSRQWAKAAEDLAEALALWRGEPLSDVPRVGAQDVRVQQWAESRLQALEGRIDADLALGRHAEVISELRALTALHPLREAFYAKLMLALYRAHRQADALDVFQALRRTLVDELGVEPAASLQQLHRRILRADPTLALADDDAAPRASGQFEADSGGPQQLPADTRAFTGRERELDELTNLALDDPPVVCTIDGMAGIGKTSLAVHAARRLRERFPDGQLFLDLHGHTAGVEPVEPGAALDYLLRSLGAPPSQIPENPDERAAFYRDRLSGTRTLIVLDNAAGSAQIRPLLPGDSGCMVIVTSRKRLAGLDDAHSLSLDLLPENDAIALLHKVAGPGRVAEEHPATAELVALCGYIPLAVRIAAARLRHRKALSVEDVVAWLRDENARLDHLEDEERSVAAIFDLSCRQLTYPERRLFGLLALIPGPDADAYAAAALADVDPRSAERLLDRLVDHNLLIQHAPGRYGFHDLIRLYARRLGASDPDRERDAALDRLLTYYQHTAYTADRRVIRYHRPEAPPTTPLPAAAPDLDDVPSARAWLHDERRNLLAAAHAHPDRAITLSASLAATLARESRWEQAVALHRTVAAAARKQGNLIVEANAVHDLARAFYSPGNYPAANAEHERALALYREIGNRLGEANSLHDLARVRMMVGDLREAAVMHELALKIYQDLDEPLGEANSLHELARVRHFLGELVVAARLHEQVRDLYRRLGDRLGEANSLHDLGHIRLLTGDRASALDLFGQALAIFRERGIRQGEANIQWELGRAYLTSGDYPAARAGLEQALTIFREMGLRIGEAYALTDLARMHHALGDQPIALDLLEQSLAVVIDLGDRQGEANARQALGQARHATGEHARAKELYDRALAIYREVGDRHGEAEALIYTARLVAETTGAQEARDLYRQALQVARDAASLAEQAQALDGAARCAALLGDTASARAELAEAVAIYRRTGALETAAAETYLAELEGTAAG